PTKGMSLPFISAGLSNLLLMGLLLGIILNTQRTWGHAALEDERAMREVLARTLPRFFPHEQIPHLRRRHRRAPVAGHRAGRGAGGARARVGPARERKEGRCAPAGEISA